MDPGRWRVVREVFDRCLEMPPAEREAFLAEACRDDPELRAEVDSLVQAHETDPDFLERPAGSLWGLGGEGPGLEGTRVGPYRLLRRLGAGGMGVVYAAEREEYRQRVALKLIRGDLDGGALRRFAAERQILASLAHPNVARLLDAGVSDGRHYLVMEHVAGSPIDRYCEERGLDLPRRLRLFREACAAVQYAHQNLVIHRDLKPSNILVSDEGRVKLLDFGIARLLDPAEAGATATTVTARPVLTPDYASPEQLRGEPLTTACDVYALGALLYVLLTGRRPLPLAGLPFHEAYRVICEQDPEPPSRTAPRLARALVGDLDAIALKALRKEPRERYASVEALSEDVSRQLEGLPVAAARGSTRYRLGKFVRRHRGTVTAAAVAALVVLGFSGAMARQARQLALERDAAETARQRAVSEQARAEAVSTFLRDMLASADPTRTRGRELSVGEVLDSAAAQLESPEGNDAQPAVQATLHHTLGLTYMRLGDLERAETHQHRALELRRAHLGNADPETLRSMNLLGVLHFQQGRLEETEALWREALELRRQVLGPEAHRTLSTMSNLSVLYTRMGRYADAESQMQETLALQRKVLGEDHPETLTTLNNLAGLYDETGRHDASAQLHREALRVRRASLGDDHPDTLQSLYNVAHLELDRGRYAEAWEVLSETVAGRLRVLGAEHPATLRAQVLLADADRLLGRHADAQRRFRESLEILERRLGTGHEDALRARIRLGLSLLESSDLAAAAPLLEEAYRISRPAPGEAPPPSAVSARTALAELALARGRAAAALAHAEAAAEAARARYGAAHGATLDALDAQVRALQRLGRASEAATLAATLAEGRARTLGDEHPKTDEARRWAGGSAVEEAS